MGATDNAVIHAIALSTGDEQGANRSAEADFGRGETFVIGFRLWHSGTSCTSMSRCP